MTEKNQINGRRKNDQGLVNLMRRDSDKLEDAEEKAIRMRIDSALENLDVCARYSHCGEIIRKNIGGAVCCLGGPKLSTYCVMNGKEVYSLD